LNRETSMLPVRKKNQCLDSTHMGRGLHCFAIFVVLMLSFSLLKPWTGLAQAPGETILYQESFDSGQASGWQLDPGWQLTQDEGNWVLAGLGHEWARPSPTFEGDFRLVFRLKLLRGRIHLVYRTNQIGRYYIGFHQGGSDLNKQYWPDTFNNNLTSRNTTHRLNTWHQVEIIGEGARLRFLVDGKMEWEYTDSDPLLDGSFAFETLQESSAYVDDISVYAPGSAPAVSTQATPSVPGKLTWVRTGGPLGGLGYDVRMSPDNPDRMYVTDAWAGVFMSSDGGQTWQPSNQGITTRTGSSGDAIPVFCLTIDPHNPDIIWVGTQNKRGIFKSIDGGLSWKEMDKGVVESEGITFRGVTVDPRSSDIVYAAAELSSYVWNGQPRNGREFDMTAGVVYKTKDGGQSWRAVWRGKNLARYMWIDPRNPDVVYLSTGIFDREAANSDPQKGIPGGEGVLKSTDGGQTWAQVNQGLQNLYVGTLFMHPQNPDILLAGTGNNQYNDGNGAYLTTDGGNSWQRTLSGDNINAVEFAASDPNIAYAGSSNAIYRSQDGGRTWQRVSGGTEGWGPSGVRAGFPIDFQVDLRDPNRIFANEYGGGNFLSTDGGRTWSLASAGYTGAQVRDIVVDPTTGRVYAAARSGIFVSEDGGNNWTGLNKPPAFSMEWYVVAIDPTDPQHILASNNWNKFILNSQDGGLTWEPIEQSPAENMSWRAIAFAPSNPKIIYAGVSAFFSAGTLSEQIPSGGIYVSRDGGKSWSPANDAHSQDANVTYLAIDPGDPSLVYAATGNHGLLKTSDGGQNWKEINQGLPHSLAALSVVLHPSQPGLVFVGLGFGGLFRSNDGGQTWKQSARGLNPEASIYDLLFDPTDPQTMYTADPFSGVYRSTDGGNTWRAINNGLRMRAANQLALTTDGQHLYAATEGEGVFRLDFNDQPPLPNPSALTAPTSPATPSEAPLPTSISPQGQATLPDASTPMVPTSPSPASPVPSPAAKLPCSSAFLLPLVITTLVYLRIRKAG
jgi:photosystem II stability/assembly factor-like uncharacterized protein